MWGKDYTETYDNSGRGREVVQWEWGGQRPAYREGCEAGKGLGLGLESDRPLGRGNHAGRRRRCGGGVIQRKFPFQEE